MANHLRFKGICLKYNDSIPTIPERFMLEHKKRVNLYLVPGNSVDLSTTQWLQFPDGYATLYVSKSGIIADCVFNEHSSQYGSEYYNSIGLHLGCSFLADTSNADSLIYIPFVTMSTFNTGDLVVFEKENK